MTDRVRLVLLEGACGLRVVRAADPLRVVVLEGGAGGRPRFVREPLGPAATQPRRVAA